MSTARYGKKWADVDEEDDDDEIEDQNKGGGTRFETQADKDGIKTVIEYLERDGKTYKVTKKVKQTTVKSWTNQSMIARKNMPKFGKPMLNEAGEKQLCVKSEEDVMIELTRKPAIVASIKDDAEEKFYEESLDLSENLVKERIGWAQMNRARQLERDEKGVGEETTDKKPDTQGGAGGLQGGRSARSLCEIWSVATCVLGEGPNYGFLQRLCFHHIRLSRRCTEGNRQSQRPRL